MTARTRATISSFPRGHEFPPRPLKIDRENVRAYLAAVGDENAYGDSIPPLCAVALALQALQVDVELPDGSLHIGQEVDHSGALLPGAELTMSAWVAQRSERQGYVITVLGFDVASVGGGSVGARTTIMAPGADG